MDWKNQLTKTPYLVLFIVLISIGAVAVFSPTQPVSAGGPLVILDDNDGGACEGSDIGKWNNRTKTCRLTVDLENSDGIEIGDDDITLNCADHLLNGTGSGDGISITGQNGVTIKNCHVSKFERGIFLGFSHTNTIKDNTFNENGIVGLKLFLSHENTLTGNTASGNVLPGISVQLSNGNVLFRNHADGNKGNGIELTTTSNNLLKQNTANGNGFSGIRLSQSNEDTLIENTANGNDFNGIALRFESNENNLIRNTVNENRFNGIGLEPISNENILKQNTAKKNLVGFSVSADSEQNTFEKNKAMKNGQLGYKDLSEGSGNVGTGNFYIENKCSTNGSDKDDGSEPDNLCSPQE